MNKFFYMREFLVLACSLLVTFSTYAQNIGIGTDNPHPSAELDIQSTQRGFLPPRMTFAQRNGIVNPAQGLMIYCTDCGVEGEWQGFTGIRWVKMNGELASAPIQLVDYSVSSVTIGSQIWSNKNLSVVCYRNGDTIPQVTDATEWANLTTGAWCWYNNDSATYAPMYGRLYNWYAVNDPRGLAPQGWRVPTEMDWNKLIKYLDSGARTTIHAIYHQSLLAGGALKSTTGWINPNTGATNSSLYTALPGGLRDNDGLFAMIGITGNWWSSEEIHSESAYFRRLDGFTPNVDWSFVSKLFGFSVRIVRDTSISIPMLNTNAATSITNNTASSGGNITNDGGAAVTARGVVWSTSPNPTIALSTKTMDGIGTGTFTSSITGLTSNTTYYIRAFATNNLGTAYGSEITFTTQISQPVDTTIHSVAIGSQIWSNKNLNVTRYRNGDPIPQVTDTTQWASLTTGAWCWYNNDSAAYGSLYGRLYNWYAVNDPRGLAPQGWHVPTEIEWDQLISTIGGYPGAGYFMKNCLTSGYWPQGTPPDPGCDPLDPAAHVEFNALPAGARNGIGESINQYYNGYFWSATAFDAQKAWSRSLSYNNTIVGKEYILKTFGFSVRLIRD